MTNKEWLELSREQNKIYAGILFQNQVFAQGADAVITYEMDDPHFVQLREKYDLEKVAGKGSDFARAKRILHYLAPRLTHSSWYDNHVPCNALDLLAYSFEQPEHGINCLNKSKILAECCLALGIYARRVSIMPYSPYDFDNHVVTEIYDRKMEKWIMLDPTTAGFFVDEDKKPLSLLEMRHKFANDQFITFVLSTDRCRDLAKSREKNSYYNSYICKNLFYFMTGQCNGFGPTDRWLCFTPDGFSVKDTDVANARFRCNHLPEAYAHLKEQMLQRLERKMAEPEPEKTSIDSMKEAPERKGRLPL